MAQRALDVLGHGCGEAEAAATHHLGEAGREELARHEERARLDHAPDRRFVQAVAVVDDIDPRVERHVERLAVGDVPAHQRAALVRRLDARR